MRYALLLHSSYCRPHTGCFDAWPHLIRFGHPYTPDQNALDDTIRIQNAQTVRTEQDSQEHLIMSSPFTTKEMELHWNRDVSLVTWLDSGSAKSGGHVLPQPLLLSSVSAGFLTLSKCWMEDAPWEQSLPFQSCLCSNAWIIDRRGYQSLKMQMSSLSCPNVLHSVNQEGGQVGFSYQLLH